MTTIKADVKVLIMKSVGILISPVITMIEEVGSMKYGPLLLWVNKGHNVTAHYAKCCGNKWKQMLKNIYSVSYIFHDTPSKNRNENQSL